MAQAVTSSEIFGGGRYQARDALPIGEINTTPLIDVMLVLLIMFIITVPTQTHQVEVNLPTKSDIIIKRLKNDLGLSAAGALSWNGQEITDSQLAGALAAVAHAPEPPEVHFRPDARVRYDRVDEVLVIAARSGASTFGFAGNEQYHDSF